MSGMIVMESDYKREDRIILKEKEKVDVSIAALDTFKRCIYDIIVSSNNNDNIISYVCSINNSLNEIINTIKTKQYLSKSRIKKDIDASFVSRRKQIKSLNHSTNTSKQLKAKTVDKRLLYTFPQRYYTISDLTDCLVLRQYSDKEIETDGIWTKWNKLVPEHFKPNATIAINDYEFIVAADEAIVAYDAKLNSWKQVFKYPEKRVYVRFIAYNDLKKEVYMLGSGLDLYRVNLQTKQNNYFPLKRKLNCQRMLFADRYVHFIARFKRNDSVQHIVWDCSNDKFKTVFDFESADFGCHAFIHLKKENKLVILGGSRYKKDDAIYTFDLNVFNGSIDTIVTENDAKEAGLQWIKLQSFKMTRKLRWYSYVLTKDERYLVRFYGRNKKEKQSKTIEILDLHEIKWYQSIVTIPPPSLVVLEEFFRKTNAPAAIFLNEFGIVDAILLLNGYIRKLNLKLFIPNDIISILVKMYDNYDGYIHMLQQGFFKADSNHFRISLDTVLKGAVKCIYKVIGF